MQFGGRVWMQVLCALALPTAWLRADPGDTEGSKDYPSFPRVEGFTITDYDEDNPAEFDFPIARPTPGDSNNVQTIHVRGHRFVVRYELGRGGKVPTLFQTQQYYEQLALAAGYTIEKTGAVGDVSETFRKVNGTHEVWVNLMPAVTSNVVTVVESNTVVPLTPASIALQPEAPAAPAPMTSAPAVSALGPAPTAATPHVDSNDDSLFDSLNQDGRAVVPFVFQPGKDTLDPDSQPLVDRVAAMMKKHPDLFLRIEGHTDNTGDPDANLRLSAQRAIAIQSALIEDGIVKKRLDPVGVGGLQPLASNETAAGREKNRRIELVIWKMNPALRSGHKEASQEQ